DSRVGIAGTGNQPRAAWREGLPIPLPLLLEDLWRVLMLAQVQEFAGRIENCDRIRPRYQASEEKLLKPCSRSGGAGTDGQRLDRMAVAEDDVTAPGGNVAAQEDPPEAKEAVDDKGAFTRCAYAHPLPDPPPKGQRTGPLPAAAHKGKGIV